MPSARFLGDPQVEEIWLRIDPPGDGEYNMAEDLRLLSRAEENRRRATCVRFYQWSSATVSIGRHQTEDRSVDLSFCRAHRIPWVRRPTGGRAVLHDAELTYAVVSNDPEFVGCGIIDTYRRIGEALQRAFTSIGIAAELARAELEEAPLPRGAVQKPCFATPSRYELLVGGRKLAGSAQRRLRNAILQHGSVPLEIDYVKMGRVLGFSPEILRSRMISVREAAGRPVDFTELAHAMEDAFIEGFGRRKGAEDEVASTA
jgi:lipoate-protein ligase A